jgi:hypothetical protein
MASIIPGYEYDIFISYRQKDNQPTPRYGWQSKGDRWVSEFVEALKQNSNPPSGKHSRFV